VFNGSLESSRKEIRKKCSFRVNLFDNWGSIYPKPMGRCCFSPWELGDQPPMGLTPICLGGTLTLEGEFTSSSWNNARITLAARPIPYRWVQRWFPQNCSSSHRAWRRGLPWLASQTRRPSGTSMSATSPSTSVLSFALSWLRLRTRCACVLLRGFFLHGSLNEPRPGIRAYQPIAIKPPARSDSPSARRRNASG